MEYETKHAITKRLQKQNFKVQNGVNAEWEIPKILTTFFKSTKY